MSRFDQLAASIVVAILVLSVLSMPAVAATPSVTSQGDSAQQGGSATVSVSFENAQSVKLSGIPDDWTISSHEDSGASAFNNQLSSNGIVGWVWFSGDQDAKTVSVTFSLPADATSQTLDVKVEDSDGNTAMTTASVSIGSPDASIAGEVSDVNGNSIGGADVQISDADGLVTTTATQSDGTFGPISVAGDADYTIEISKSEFTSYSATRHVAAGETEQITATLERNRYADELHVAPWNETAKAAAAGEAILSADGASTTKTPYVVWAADQFNDPLQNSLSVDIDFDNAPDTLGDFYDNNAVNQAVSITLDGTRAGDVDADGTPESYALVYVTADAATESRFNDLGYSGSSVTEPVTATAVNSQGTTLSDGSAVTYTIETAESGFISGTITDTAGKTLENARYEITNSGTGTTVATGESSDGVFTVSVAPATYRVVVTKEGYQDFSTTISVTSNETKDIHVTLEESSSTEGKITGEVVDLNINPVPTGRTDETYVELWVEHPETGEWVDADAFGAYQPPDNDNRIGLDSNSHYTVSNVETGYTYKLNVTSPTASTDISGYAVVDEQTEGTSTADIVIQPTVDEIWSDDGGDDATDAPTVTADGGSAAPGEVVTVTFSIENTGSSNYSALGFQLTDVPGELSIVETQSDGTSGRDLIWFWLEGLPAGVTHSVTLEVEIPENASSGQVYTITGEAETTDTVVTKSVDVRAAMDNRFAGPDGEVGFGDVLNAISAFNEGTKIGGEDVSFSDVLDVISAFNDS